MRRSEPLPSLSPRFVAFAWRYHPCAWFAPIGRGARPWAPGSWCSGSRAGIVGGNGRVSQVPGRPLCPYALFLVVHFTNNGRVTDPWSRPMLGVSSLKTLRPIALGVFSCLALRHFIARPSLISSSPRPDASSTLAPQRRTSGSAHAWSCSLTNPPRFPTWQPLLVSIFIPVPSAVGGNAGPEVSSPSGRIRAGAESRSFPPLDRAVVASIACDVVARTGDPLSRQSTTDLANRAAEELNRPIGRTTVWQILDADAIKPWQYEHWIFP